MTSPPAETWSTGWPAAASSRPGQIPDNRRRKLIRITDEGLQRLAAAAPQQREVHAAALAGLSETDRAELNRLLLKMLGLPAALTR